MEKEITTLINKLENVHSGEPWYGRAMFKLLDEINPANAHIKINPTAHSLADLLYHLLTWADFVLARIESDADRDLLAFEEIDWREINPKLHTWQEGLLAFKSTYDKIIDRLREKDDSLLNEIVDFRTYTYRYMIEGLIQHNIYHLGQIVYLNQLLSFPPEA